MTDEFAQALTAEIEREQAYLNQAYGLLDDMRATASRIAEGFEKGSGGTHQARLEREAVEEISRRRMVELNIGELPLCFGRLDSNGAAPMRYYIGRLSVNDAEQEPVIIDWRAPVAEPFYRATPKDMMGVVRRRHFQLEGRHIVSLDDEVFDEDAADSASLTVVGEAALIAALERHRGGQMRDIVATIQADQDRAIREPLQGIFVVTGGPGTGKTAVALHRAAYLLYTHRAKLAAEGVLIIGPNPLFLHYIDEVLPSLGEDDVQLSTILSLKPQLKLGGDDPVEVAELKGDARMATVIRRALVDRTRPIRTTTAWSIDGRALALTPRQSARIIGRARRRKGTHNERRPYVVRLLLDHLLEEYWAASPAVRDEDVDADVRMRLRTDPITRRVLERMWPILSGEELLNGIFEFPPLFRSAASGVLSSEEQEIFSKGLHRTDETTWSTADVALVDEADAMCGAVESARSKRKRNVDRRAISMAAQVIREHGLSGFLTAEQLAARYGEPPPPKPTRPGLRRFGHVLVDEAQDLTAMQWRMLARRCPSGSMTLVGDFGQSSQPGALSTWKEVFQHLPSTHRDIAELRVNYRTPSEIMHFANPLLLAVTPHLRPPDALRDTDEDPEIVHAPSALSQRTAELAKQRVDRGGAVAVIAPSSLHDDLHEVLAPFLDDENPLVAKIALLDATSAKGLEFDHVIVVEPAQLVPQEPRGLRLLYVALTRATHTLAVVHDLDLPEPLRKGSNDR